MHSKQRDNTKKIKKKKDTSACAVCQQTGTVRDVLVVAALGRGKLHLLLNKKSVLYTRQ